jgi:hypothetical protein
LPAEIFLAEPSLLGVGASYENDIAEMAKRIMPEPSKG